PSITPPDQPLGLPPAPDEEPASGGVANGRGWPPPPRPALSATPPPARPPGSGKCGWSARPTTTGGEGRPPAAPMPTACAVPPTAPPGDGPHQPARSTPAPPAEPPRAATQRWPRRRPVVACGADRGRRHPAPATRPGHCRGAAP